MTARVLVVGGGYGGTAAAKALDDIARVTLVEPKDAFVHNVAALRGLVDPAWPNRLFFPYGRLLRHGRVVRDRAIRVDGTSVTLGSGERLEADYLILASGSAYPFPAKYEAEESADAKKQIRGAYENLAEARSVLLLGAGPVGLELAGEIKGAWPGTKVAVVDPADNILTGGLPEEFRTEVRRQLDELAVELLLGTSLRTEPPSNPGEFKTFTVSTDSDRELTADIWFRCYGARPAAGYLTGESATARRSSGHVAVTPELRLAGQERVFAIGDLTDVAEPKTGAAAGAHAELVAGNIRTLIRGGTELSAYEPAEPSICMPLGPHGGASYAAELGVLGAAETAEMKGRDMMLDRFSALMRVAGQD